MPQITLSETPVERERSAIDLTCHPIDFDQIPRAAWDRLVARTPSATPFARWTVHRAWWDAYGATAHDHTLVACSADSPNEFRAIVPLMHRHMTEPEDDSTATVLRRGNARDGGTAVEANAKAVFFGASYHADYATVLADPADLPAVADALVDTLSGPPDLNHGAQDWDVVDLRRLRSADPALPALEKAFRSGAQSHGWHVVREREDVCPVVTFPAGGWDEYLGTLGKKARHEVRRKLRRAEAHGPITLNRGVPSEESINRFFVCIQLSVRFLLLVD